MKLNIPWEVKKLSCMFGRLLGGPISLAISPLKPLPAPPNKIQLKEVAQYPTPLISYALITK